MGRVHQHHDESLLKHCHGFMAAVEHIKEACSKIEPDELTKSMTEGSEKKEGQDQFLGCGLIARSTKTEFEDCGEKLADDCANDQESRCPKTFEETVVVMQAHLDNHSSNVKKGTNFNQVDLIKVKCHECNKLGHFRRDCPEENESEDGDMSSEMTVDVW